MKCVICQNDIAENEICFQLRAGYKERGPVYDQTPFRTVVTFHICKKCDKKRKIRISEIAKI